MSDAQSNPYKVDPGPGVKEQIEAIKNVAKQAGKLAQFVEILEVATQMLQSAPNGWGDPEYRSKHVDGVYCHALLRPVVFRYVVYEEVHGVVLLSVRLFADFE